MDWNMDWKMSQFIVYRYTSSKYPLKKKNIWIYPYIGYIFIIDDICLCAVVLPQMMKAALWFHVLHSRVCLIVDFTQCILVGLHLLSFPAVLRMLKSNVRIPPKLPASEALVWWIFLRSLRVLAHLCDLGSCWNERCGTIVGVFPGEWFQAIRSKLYIYKVI